MAEHRESEYEDFLESLQSEIAERVEVLRTRQSAAMPSVFLDPDKTISDWPELNGRVIEELR